MSRPPLADISSRNSRFTLMPDSLLQLLGGLVNYDDIYIDNNSAAPNERFDPGRFGKERAHAAS